MHRHLCQKEVKSETFKYQFRHCKACREVMEIKKRREEFDKLMMVSLDWDEVNVLV